MGVVVIVMHSRGDAGMNKGYTEYEGGVIEGVKVELGKKVRQIVNGRGGLRRWHVIVDPGIGFSKDTEDNLSLLRHASRSRPPAALALTL
jgi:dihydroneopterin aldolase/2-amino-4-hydroxy-6-hydroxymethyldihydropteridine diphosphokinase/dihydropteroate synthase